MLRHASGRRWGVTQFSKAAKVAKPRPKHKGMHVLTPCKDEHSSSTPPLSYPTPGKTVPRPPLGDGCQVTVPHPPLGEPYYHCTRTFAVKIAA